MNSTHLAQKLIKLTLAAVLALPLAARAHDTNWEDQAISPVGNPIYFEDPRITTELRPIFMEHWLPSTFDFNGGHVPLGGEVRVFALQLRLALSDRLAFIATKDGYIEMRPDNTLGHSYGWADIAGGLKYKLIDDVDNQLIVTPGFTITAPIGTRKVYQGYGKGEWNLFVSGEKGFDKFHVTGNLGFRIPNDFSAQTAQTHYSLQMDYYVCQYFIPFFVGNGYTILSKGDRKLLGVVDLNTEMYDLINFGSTKAVGTTQLTVGGGARSKITKNIDIGVAYEAGVVNPVGIFASRLTADAIFHF